jgi:hypothetical protein
VTPTTGMPRPPRLRTTDEHLAEVREQVRLQDPSVFVRDLTVRSMDRLEARANAASAVKLRADVASALGLEEYRDEKAVQRAVWQLLGVAGCKSYWLSQMRKTGQTKGIADILTFHARRGEAWIETKHPTDMSAVQSEDQREFQRQVELTGGTYLLVRHPQTVADWLGGKT